MANNKISALTSASTPLAGTEVLPIVQSSATVKVSVANLTAGRAVSAASLTLTTPLAVANGGTGVTTSTGTGNTVLSATPTLSGDVTLSTGNLVIGTAGKGIDFSATAGTGTSELLADYEEGTWTPTFEGNTTPGTITASTLSATYTKVGRIVQIQVYAIFTVTVAGLGFLKATLPFSKAGNTMFCGPLNTYNIDLPAGAVDSVAVPTSLVATNNTIIFTVSTDNGATGIIDASSLSTGDEILFAFAFIAA